MATYFGRRITMSAYDTIVIGMGAAGCSAASVLCRAGKKVLALEAQNRIGGRVNTVPLGDGVVELGAEWIHGERSSRVYEHVVENKIPVLAQNISFQVFKSDGSESDENIVNDLVGFAMHKAEDPPKDPEPLGQFLTREIKEYLRVNYPTVLKDQEFLEQFLKLMDLIMDNYTAANSWNDLSTHSTYETLEGESHLSWHKYGYKTLFDILLNTYKNGPGYPNLDLQLEKVVTKISYPQDPNENVAVTCQDGSTYQAKNIIVTVSLGVLKERHDTLFSPPIPKAKAAIIDTISMGVMDKIVMLFPETWWRSEPSFSAFLWKERDAANVPQEDLWVTKILGASSPLGSGKALTLWTSGNVAKRVETLSEDLVRKKCMELVRRFMGKNKTIPEPIAILRSNWYSNPYTRGSYSFDNLLTPHQPHARALLAEPLTDSSGAPRVLFAGEATHPIHFSTVHGAMDTGYMAANRLLLKAKM